MWHPVQYVNTFLRNCFLHSKLIFFLCEGGESMPLEDDLQLMKKEEEELEKANEEEEQKLRKEVEERSQHEKELQEHR